MNEICLVRSRIAPPLSVSGGDSGSRERPSGKSDRLSSRTRDPRLARRPGPNDAGPGDITSRLENMLADDDRRTADRLQELDVSVDASDMTFRMTNYHKDLLKMMSMMRCHQMLTDVTLVVGNERLQAHKVMLAAASPYFKAMFTGGLKETQSSTVTLHDICPSIMTRLIGFIYTGQIHITELAVCQLLPAASMLQITDVIMACCIFLERQLSPANALGISFFADQHCCTELHKKATEYIMQHFAEVCQEEEFMQLTKKQLVNLIRKDELNVKEETEVYNAVLKWVKYNEDERRPSMHCVLSEVRCQFLTPSFLNQQMKNCDVIRKMPACKEYLAQIFKELTLHKRVSVRERTPNSPRIVYVAGGFLRQSLDTLEAFNLDTGSWSTLAHLTLPRSGLGAAFVKGILYAIGGRNNTPGCSYDSDWVDRDTWRPCSPMTTARNRVGVGVVDGMIYAVGGCAGPEHFNSVEKYDPEEDKWYAVKPMQNKRVGVGVAVVNRLLYAIGGFDGQERLKTVERYHPETDTWCQVASMSIARSGSGVTCLNNYIYVVGGYDGVRQLDDVERYDTELDRWERVSGVSLPRSALSVAAIDNRIFAIGGFDGQEFVSTVEIYDPALDRWSFGVPMTSSRSGHASAVSFSAPFAPAGSSR
ncbi:kelch-like ECH-associated protein 1 isoform X2 [Cimex lectularius]|uniref:Kelch-like protein diablo n=1 Tax=Cimex lectularius TaxID=79782 RepID=A0A8I6S5S1_CIMLE|nr:kelch-like ECH-associated protein 1 isoform X2 [Cimex lectularius]